MSSTRSVVLRCSLVVAGSVVAASAVAQEELHRAEGDISGYGLGRRIASVGDVTGDGIADYAASGLGAHVLQPYPVGVYSGADGSLLHFMTGDPETGLGTGLGAVGDVNGDTVPDYAAADPWRDRVWVLSGVDSSRIRTVHFATSGMFGFSIHSHPDLNGDGVRDMLVGSPGEIDPGDGNPNQDGFVHAYSGSDGAFLFSIQGADKQYGWDTADVDGDGTEDIVIGSPEAGLVEVYSGTTQVLLQSWSKKRKFGHSVAGVPDLDGDGCDEVLVGAPSRTDWDRTGKAWVFNGRTGRSIYKWERGAGETFGFEVAMLDDANGDSVPDFLVGIEGRGGRKEAELFSGRHGTLLDVIRRPRGVDGVTWFGNGVESATDLDGDGLTDLLVGDRAYEAQDSIGGCVFALRANPLYLHLSDRDPTPGAPLTLRVAQGTTGALAILIVESIDGVPCDCMVAGPAALDGEGVMEWSFTPTNDWAGKIVELRAWVLEPNGDLLTTAVKELHFQ